MKKLTALLLAFLLTAGLSLPVWGADAPTVRISSAYDLHTLAENCRSDTYSVGKTFLLTADIYLSEAFTPIPYFAGTFDGGGHAITGVTCGEDGSRQGLFRQIAKGGRVENLTVNGDIAPDGSGVYVGGIVGYNAGAVVNCTFAGTVRGIESVGGIAGGNTGVIKDCTFTGSAAGEHRIGGITGDNFGVVADCTGAGRVNNQVVTPAESRFDISLLTDVGEEDILDITDVGGIAGLNGGVIQNCESRGAVGYAFTGYNVGGIVGRTDGFVDNCHSTAAVLGRRDAGGIAGQLEPHTAWDLSDSKLRTLRAQLLELNSLTSQATADASRRSALIARDLTRLSAGTDKAASEINAMLDTDGDGTVSDTDLPASWTDLPALAADSENKAHWAAAWDGLKAAFAAAASLSENTGDALVGASRSLSAITEQMSRVSDTLYAMLETLGNDRELETDISLRNAYTQNDGAIADCTFDGSVIADTNCGGMAGSVAMEVSFDLEDALHLSDYLFTNARYLIFACIRGCTALGDVTARSESAGGIAGRMDFGAAVDCVAGGAVTTEKGDYTGGVAGQCQGSLLRCCARTVLRGKGYVGGIMGLGGSAVQCLDYSCVDSAAEYVGAIAGWSEGVVEDCLFVENELGGIDGVSYAGRAEPVSYGQMLLEENVPALFGTITVTFLKDGETYAALEVPYGGRIDALPTVPKQGSDYWKWDADFDGSRIYYSTTVTGAYHRAITTLACGAEPADYLAEGVFYEGDRLCVTARDSSALPVPDWCSRILRADSVEVPGYEGTLRVHLRIAEDAPVFLSDEKGGYVPADTVRDGSYLVFTVPNGADFVVAQGMPSPVPPLLLGGALPVVLAVVNALLRRGKRRRKAADA